MIKSKINPLKILSINFRALRITGECPAVDFEIQLYNESLYILENHLKPVRHTSGIILEQSFLSKMTEGIQPLALLALNSQGMQK